MRWTVKMKQAQPRQHKRHESGVSSAETVDVDRLGVDRYQGHPKTAWSARRSLLKARTYQVETFPPLEMHQSRVAVGKIHLHISFTGMKGLRRTCMQCRDRPALRNLAPYSGTSFDTVYRLRAIPRPRWY